MPLFFSKALPEGKGKSCSSGTRERLEGIAAKEKDSIYLPGNHSDSLVKTKGRTHQEAVFWGLTESSGIEAPSPGHSPYAGVRRQPGSLEPRASSPVILVSPKNSPLCKLGLLALANAQPDGVVRIYLCSNSMNN